MPSISSSSIPVTARVGGAWSLLRLLRRVHGDERGTVSLESVLIIGAIALPVLVFLMRFGWPRMRRHFLGGVSDLQSQADGVRDGE